MAIKKTLLEVVQDVLVNVDGESVNSISDSIEAVQIASIAEQVYYTITANRTIPEHFEFFTLEAASNTDTPTTFFMQDNVKELCTIWYSKNAEFDYYEIDYVEPFIFVQRADAIQENYDSVDINGTKVRVRTDRNPSYYTIFDDHMVIMDSRDSTLDSTLQDSKIRCYGSLHPVFSKTDDYVPDIDGVMFPYYINEITSLSWAVLKGGSDPKIEQQAKRGKVYVQNDQYKRRRDRRIPDNGRS